MTSYIAHTTVDCAHAYALSEWWKQGLGYVDVPNDPNEPGHEECMVLSPESGHRVLDLGATQVDDQRDHHAPGIGWVVLADPEGNEFCILRSDEEMANAPMSVP